MSRAFVKESEDALPELPELPLSPHPNHVTARGLRLLRERLAANEAALAVPPRETLTPSAVAVASTVPYSASMRATSCCRGVGRCELLMLPCRPSWGTWGNHAP